MSWELLDAGRAVPGEPVLVITTPGVRFDAMLPWVEAIEDAGMDARVLHFPPRGQTVDEVVQAVRLASAGIDRVAAEGYGGVFALKAGLALERIALAGTPLAAHLVPPVLLSGEGMPFGPELLGPLPTEPFSAVLAAAYREWATGLTELPDPGCPALLVASGLDPIAPPEVVRLPSQDWAQRTWVRTGPLGLDAAELTHAQLLSDAGVAERVARFLAGEP